MFFAIENVILSVAEGLTLPSVNYVLVFDDHGNLIRTAVQSQHAFVYQGLVPITYPAPTGHVFLAYDGNRALDFKMFPLQTVSQTLALSQEQTEVVE